MRSLRTATGQEPMGSNKDPAQPKINKIILKKKLYVTISNFVYNSPKPEMTINW